MERLLAGEYLREEEETHVGGKATWGANGLRGPQGGPPFCQTEHELNDELIKVGFLGAGFQQRFRESNYQRLSNKRYIRKRKRRKRRGNKVGREEGWEEDIRVLWPGTWYMFFRSRSQAYIILVSLLNLFLFFNHSFMVLLSFLVLLIIIPPQHHMTHNEREAKQLVFIFISWWVSKQITNNK